MRDAFGGVFMMRLMLVFIVIFVGFGAISLNYAKAFRIKNKVIDLIEQQEIRSITNLNSIKDELNNIINASGYNIDCDNTGNETVSIKDDTNNVIGLCHRGITITINNEHNDSNNSYYNIITYGGWNLNFLNMLLALGGENPNSDDPLYGRWQVKGEAKVHKN